MPVKQGLYYYIKNNGTSDTLEVYDEVLSTTQHIYAIPMGTRVVYTAMVDPNYGTASNYRAPQRNSGSALAVAYRLQIPLAEASWSDIKSVAEAGVAGDFWTPGDITPPFTIKGTVGGTSVDITAVAQVIGINHNPTREGVNNVHFAIVSANTTKGGNPQPLTVLGTHQHSTVNSNFGGWRSSDLRTVCEDLFAALPANLKAVISSTPKYTDNKGYSTNVLDSSIGYTYNHIWIPALYEYTGGNPSNTFEKSYQQQYEWFKTAAHKNTMGIHWSRTPVITGTTQYSRFNKSNVGNANATVAANLLFCFAVGGYNGDSTGGSGSGGTGSGAGTGPGGTNTKSGGIILKDSVDVLDIKYLRSVPVYLKDIAVINNTAGTITADDIYFLSDGWAEYVSQSGSGANLQLYFKGIKQTSTNQTLIIVKEAGDGYDESIIRVPFKVTKTQATLVPSPVSKSFTQKYKSETQTITLTSNQEDDVIPTIKSTDKTVKKYDDDYQTDGIFKWRVNYGTNPAKPTSITVVTRKNGNSTLQITYPDTDRFLSVSTTVTLSSAYLGDLDALTPTDIQTIISSGEAQNFWKIGDTIPITLSGTVGDVNISGSYKLIIIGIDHNPTYEMQNNVHRVHFGIVSADGKYIAFCDSKYNALSTSGDAYAHYNNNTNPNAWISNGYYSSLIRARMTQLYNCFPTSWKNVIKTCVKTYCIYGDPNPHAVRDKVFIPSYRETHINENMAYRNVSKTQAVYALYDSSIGNTARHKVRADDTTVKALWHLREATNNPTSIHVMDNSAIQTKTNSINLSSGLVPCFTVASEDAPSPTVITKPTISGSFTWNANGTTVYSPTINNVKLNSYTDWVSVTVTVNSVYKYKRDFGNYTLYIQEYEGIEPGVFAIKVVLNDTINMAWGSTTGNSTDIKSSWVIRKIVVADPTIQTGTSTASAFVLDNGVYEREYNGQNITPSIQNVPATSVATRDDSRSTLTASELNTYYIYYELKDPDHYQWTSTSDSIYMLSWCIIRMKITKPSTTSTTTYTYDTKEKTVSISNDRNDSIVSRLGSVDKKQLKGTDAGTYSVTYFLSDTAKYQWSDGTNNDVTITLTINKRGINKPSFKGTNIIYDGKEKEIANSTYLNNHDATYVEYWGNGSSSDKPTNAGNYTLYARLAKGSDNTYWNYNTSDTSSVPISWSIQRAGLTKPSLSQNSFTYDVNTTVDITQYLNSNYKSAYMEIINPSDTAAKDHRDQDYQLTIHLKDNNHCWGSNNSGDTNDVILNWKINKKSGGPTCKLQRNAPYDAPLNYFYPLNSGSSHDLDQSVSLSMANLKVTKGDSYGFWKDSDEVYFCCEDQTGIVSIRRKSATYMAASSGIYTRVGTKGTASIPLATAHFGYMDDSFGWDVGGPYILQKEKNYAAVKFSVHWVSRQTTDSPNDNMRWRCFETWEVTSSNYQEASQYTIVLEIGLTN